MLLRDKSLSMLRFYILGGRLKNPNGKMLADIAEMPDVKLKKPDHLLGEAHINLAMVNVQFFIGMVAFIPIVKTDCVESL